MENTASIVRRLSVSLTGLDPIQTVIRLRGRRQVFAVGGTVRDLVLGRPTADYDFAVSGSGIVFARSFARRLKGAFVMLSDDDDEARVVKEGAVYDFIGLGKAAIDRDLRRRDFTINAIAFDLGSGILHDPAAGLDDLRRHIIRPVTDHSLTDDPLRVLRGFRFALELEFDLHDDFFRGIPDASFKKTAAERIGYELLRITAASDSYPQIQRMNGCGLFVELFPEAHKIIEDKFLWGHSLETYRSLEFLMNSDRFRNLVPEVERYCGETRRRSLLKLAALFHDIAKPDTFLMQDGEVHFYGHDTKGARIVEVLGHKRLKLSRPDVALFKKLVKEHMRPHLLATSRDLTDRALRRFMRDLGEEYFGCMMIAWADGHATGGKTRHLEETLLKMVAIQQADDAKPKIERLIDGHDLIALGLEPGPIFKPLLQELLDRQLEGTIMTKEEGLQAAREIYEGLTKGEEKKGPRFKIPLKD